MRRDNLQRADESRSTEPGRLRLEKKPKSSARFRRGRQILLWVGAGFAGLLLLLVVVAAILLRSESFHRYVLGKVDAAVAESTGARIQIHDFALRLSTLSVDLNGIMIHGAESDASAPLLQADHVGASVRIVSLLHKKWNLSNVVMDHPVAHIFVNAQGQTNFPTPRKKSSSPVSIFDLAIQHFRLDRGEIYYNDRKSQLDADLHNVNLQTSFDNSARRYHGTLEYNQGEIRSGTLRPMTHDLNAEFDLTPARFTLKQAVLKSGSSEVRLQATVDAYDSYPRVNAKYNAAVDTADAKRILRNSALPSGLIRLAGTVLYDAQPNRPPLNSVTLSGNAESSLLAVRAPSFRGDVRNVSATYRLSGGNVEIKAFHAETLDGAVDGKLTIRDLARSAQGSVEATVHNISLADARSALNNKSLQQVKLTGKVSADLNATWHGSLQDLVARANATLNAAVAPASPAAGAQGVPLDGVIHAQYAASQYKASGSELTLRQSYLRTAQTSIVLDGTASTRSNLQFHMQSNDLHELETVADQFRSGTNGAPAQPLDLYGAASFNGSISGAVSDPRINGLLMASNLRVNNSAWRALRASISLSSSRAAVANGDLESATQGRINFSGDTALQHWAYEPSAPVKIEVSASRLSLAELARLADVPTPMTGMLSMQISVHGSGQNPIGQGNVSLSQAMIAGEQVNDFNARFHGDGQAVHADLKLNIPAGSIEGDGIYRPHSQEYEARLDAANIHLDQLRALKESNLQVAGVMNLSASGRGTLHAPAGEASIQIPQLQIQKQTLQGLSLSVKVENQQATIALNSEVANTYVRGQGTLGLAGDYPVNFHMDSGQIPLQPLFAVYAPPQAADVSGQTELHATLSGPLKDKTKLAVHAEIPTLSLSYKTLQIAAATPIRFDYGNGVVTIEHTVIKGTGTDLELQGMVPVAASQPMSLSAHGTADLRLAQMLSPDLQSSGQIQFDINSRGNRQNPNVQGQVRIVDAALRAEGAPLGLAQGNGVLTLTNDRIEVSAFTGTVGGGAVQARGGVTYVPRPQFDLALAARNVRLRYPDGLRTLMNSDLALTGTPQSAQLTGQVRIERLSFTPDFDLAKFAGQFSGEGSSPSASPMMEAIRLNIAIQTTSGVNLTSAKVSLQGVANLRVVGTAADPVILGRADLTGGELFFMGTRYVVEGGTVSFLNPVRTEPVMNLQVSTVVQQYSINLNLRGPLDRLETSYSSDPTLPPVDIIHLLAFGSTTEASGNPTPGNLGAQALVAQGVSSEVSSRVEKLAGISHLSVDPVLNRGNNQNAGARVTVQQRVSGNLYVTFQTDVTSVQGAVIEGEYRASKKWSVNASRDQNGGFGAEVRYHKEF